MKQNANEVLSLSCDTVVRLFKDAPFTGSALIITSLLNPKISFSVPAIEYALCVEHFKPLGYYPRITNPASTHLKCMFIDSVRISLEKCE